MPCGGPDAYLNGRGYLLVVAGFVVVYLSLTEMASIVCPPRSPQTVTVRPPLIWFTGTQLRWTVRLRLTGRRHTADLTFNYHWVSEFAPPKAQRYLSYMTGCLCFTGW